MKPHLIEKYADNGEVSHYELINEKGEMLWTNEDGAKIISSNLPVIGSLPCNHNYNQVDTYWNRCTHCGMYAPLGQ